MAPNISGNKQVTALSPSYPSPTSTLENLQIQAMKILTLPPLWSRKFYHGHYVSQIKSRQSRTRCRQQQSHLLALPLELRIMIWNFVLPNSSMTLLWKNGRIHHYFVHKIDYSCVANFKPKMPRWYRSTSGDEEPQSLALLQTCHAIYFDLLQILYKTNTLMCFQNHALDYFYDFGRSVDLSNIRSLHMHYQFFLPRGGKKWLSSQSFQLYRSGVRLAKVPLYFPRLEKLHFCIAGPICIRSRTYDWIKDSITRICEQLEYLDVATVNLVEDPTKRNFLIWHKLKLRDQKLEPVDLIEPYFWLGYQARMERSGNLCYR